MKKLVETFFNEDQFGKAYGDLDSLIAQFSPINVSLNDQERRGLRTMAEGREGIASTISRIALAYSETLPKSEDGTELQKTLANYDRLSGFLQKVTKLREMVDDTVVALGVDIMSLTDSYTAYLQAARTRNVNLDEAMRQVDDYNSRFGKRLKEEDAETPAKS